MQTLSYYVYPPGYQSHLDPDRVLVRPRAHEAVDLMRLAESLVWREDHGMTHRDDYLEWAEIHLGLAALAV